MGIWACMRSGCRSFLCRAQPGFREALLQQRNAVVAPEGLVAEDKERHAEYVIGGCLLLAALVGFAPLAGQVLEIFLLGEADAAHQSRNRLGLIGLEFPQEKLLERGTSVIEQT